jgi:hypothetical protein
MSQINQPNTMSTADSDTRRRRSRAGSIGTVFSGQGEGPSSTRASSQNSAKTGVSFTAKQHGEDWDAIDAKELEKRRLKQQSERPGMDEVANTPMGAFVRVNNFEGGHRLGIRPATECPFDFDGCRGEVAAPYEEGTMSGTSSPSQMSLRLGNTSAASSHVSLHGPTSPIQSATAQSTRDEHEKMSRSRPSEALTEAGSSPAPQPFRRSTSPMQCATANSTHDGHEDKSRSRLSISRIGRAWMGRGTAAKKVRDGVTNWGRHLLERGASRKTAGGSWAESGRSGKGSRA